MAKKIFIELVDSGSIFHDYTQKVTLTKGNLVAEVYRTPMVSQALSQGQVKEVQETRFTEWKKEREVYEKDALEAQAKSNKLLMDMAKSSSEKIAIAEKAIKDADKAIKDAEKLKAELEAKAKADAEEIEDLKKQLADKKAK